MFVKRLKVKCITEPSKMSCLAHSKYEYGHFYDCILINAYDSYVQLYQTDKYKEYDRISVSTLKRYFKIVC